MGEELISLVNLLMVLGFALSLPVLATIHILRTRDDVSSAIAWMGMVWLVPVLGVILYLLLGINRIRRRAQADRIKQGLDPKNTADMLQQPQQDLKQIWPKAPRRWRAHAMLADRLSSETLTAGNKLTLYPSGQETIAALVEAINGATRSVALASYIFQADQAGRRIITALNKAQKRGVDVRVLVDAVGNWYGIKPVIGVLKRKNIPVASFNPISLSWRLAFFNLRTHRKMMIVDGTVAFAGGVNIRRHYLKNSQGHVEIQDTHFSFRGPVVAQVMQIFAEDWAFATGRWLQEAAWFPSQTMQKENMLVRAVADGPDQQTPITQNLFENALYCARDHVAIVTPYFIPEKSLVHALQHAALRGVRVDVVVPKQSNIPLFGLASSSGFSRLLTVGVTIYQSDHPFDHSKLFVVDYEYGVIGSSNWDARSLRLNFEFNMELYGRASVKKLVKHIQTKIEQSTPLTMDTHQNRPLWKRAFGRLLWLFSPYL